jgi:tape measure domain-containing protein
MTTVGTIEVIAKIDTSQYKQGANEITSANNKMESSGDKTTSNLSSGFKTLGKVGVAALAAVGAAITVMLVKNIDNAVNRIDTLIAFPRVLKAMGVSAGDAESATAKLSKSLEGLPTPLQEGAAGVQALVSSGLDISKATDVFLAFNNATLAASTEAGAAQGAFTQLVQSISKGKIEGQEWNSLLAAMPTAFQGLSKASGKSREELRELYRTNPQQLLDDLVKLNKEGGGGIASLDEQARLATGGIGTSFSNLNNAVTRGMEGIVRALGNGDLQAGQEKISNAVSSFGSVLEVGLNQAGKFFAFIADNQVLLYSLAGIIGGVLIAGLVALGTVIVGFVTPAMAGIIAVFALVGAAIGLIKQNWDLLEPTVMKFWSAIQQVGSFLASVFKPAIDDMINSLKEAWAAFMPLWKQIDGFVVPALKALAIAFAVGIVLPAAIATASLIAITFAVIKVISWLSKVYTAIFNFANGAIKAFRSFASGVGSAISTAISWVASLPGRIKNTLGNLGSLLIGAGKDLINGLIAGIKASPGRVVDAIKSIANGAKEAFKGFLGIKSPSKVFAGYGTNITEGLVGGISAGMGQVDSAVAGLSANVISPSIDASLSSDQGNQQQSSNPNINITINPEGIIARSRSDLRDIAKDLVRSINEELQAKQQPVIGGGNI